MPEPTDTVIIVSERSIGIGPTGPTGATGDTGETGPTGESGSNGLSFEVSSQYRAGTGQVVKFDDPSYQSIISAPDTTDTYPTAQRLVVQGPNGFPDSNGEGGDVYLWAGNGAADNGSGGDIKADGGYGSGTGSGGSVKVRGGYSPQGTGGFVQISSGSSSDNDGGSIHINSGYSDYESGGTLSIYTGNGQNSGGSLSIFTGSGQVNGGDIDIYAGYGNEDSGGTVTISGGNTSGGTAGNVQLETFSGGKVILVGDGGEFLGNSDDPDNQIATVGYVDSSGGTKAVRATKSMQQEGDPILTYITFDVHEYSDLAELHSTSVDTDRFIAPSSGRYRLLINLIAFDNSIVKNEFFLEMVVYDSTDTIKFGNEISLVRSLPFPDGRLSINYDSGLIELSAGDYIRTHIFTGAIEPPTIEAGPYTFACFEKVT